MKTIKMDSVDIDLDDTNAGHADALDGAFVMGVAERLGIAWALRSKVGNQNLPVYTFTGPRAALREFCRIIVPNGSFDPLGDEEPAPAPPAPRELATNFLANKAALIREGFELTATAMTPQGGVALFLNPTTLQKAEIRSAEGNAITYIEGGG